MNRLVNLAVVFGLLGQVLTSFIIVVYYLHLCTLPCVSAEATRYEASTLSAAIAFLAFSLGMGLTALATRNERKSCFLMLLSTFTAIIGYIFPSERLWRLGYISALNETISIALIHAALLTSSLILLKIHHKS